MAGKIGSKTPPSERPRPGDGVYLDSSAFVKLCLPEPESESLDRFLVGRRDLVISELTITEVISAVVRSHREGLLSSKHVDHIHDAVLSDARSGTFRRLDISPAIHRAAEQLLLATKSSTLRTLDALHIALASSGGVKFLITFDTRMSEAAVQHGLGTITSFR
jgi:predicted nucleic acid-binding protein